MTAGNSGERIGGARAPVDVAVGILIRPDGRLLLASRPAGKPYSGYWEFPGGKLEPGETVAHALARELHEELGVDIGPVFPWLVRVFDYPHALVRLHFCRVFEWRGELHAREQAGLRLLSARCAADAPAAGHHPGAARSRVARGACDQCRAGLRHR